MNKVNKILVTGDDGYIANKFNEYVKKNEKFEVTLISVKDDDWKKMDFSKYKAIIHLAGIVHRKDATREEYESVNYKLSIELAEKAKKQNIEQFIFFSTASVYGNVRGMITSETRTNPDNFYGESKLRAEHELKKMESDKFKICIVRPPMIYGKGCKGNYCTLSKLARKIPIFPKVNNKRSMLYIENLCEFIKLLIINKESGLFFPQDKEFVNTSKMVGLIAKENNHKILISSILNPFVVLGKHIPGKIGNLFNKVFGDLYYDINLSNYKENYNIKTFEQSIHDTEY